MVSMTMIAIALSDETVVQVVDRRITKGGVLYDDLANKMICGVSTDASFSIAYTGLMMIPTRTDEWLANFLSSDKVLALRLPEILERLASALTQEFARLSAVVPKDQRRLTLAFAGFCVRGPFAAIVSNQESDDGKVLKEPNQSFKVSMYLFNAKTPRKLDMVFYGAEPAISGDLLRAIAKIRRVMFRKPGARIASALIAVVRRAAKHPIHGHLISLNCTSSVLSANSPVINCDDHFVGYRRKGHLPHFVTPTHSFKHVWFQAE